MNTRQHAVLSRALVQAAGGADNCLNLLEETPFKIGRTHLYDCMDHDTGRTLPAGAIAVLESHSGHRAYSQALTGVTAPPSDAECAVAEICEANENSALAQRLVRLAAQDRVFTEQEKREIEPFLQAIEARVRGVRAAMDAGSAK